MADNSSRWIIRDAEGKVRGPYPTSKIIQYINTGVIGGGEMIARYPDGEWQAISKNPEFYDRLLEVLAGEANVPDKIEKPPPPPNVTNRVVSEEETQHGPAGDHEITETLPFQNRKDPQTGERIVIRETKEYPKDGLESGDDDEDEFVMNKGESLDGTLYKERPGSSLDNSDVLDLGYKEQILKKGKAKKLKVPIIVGAVLLLGLIYWMTLPPPLGERVHLRAPGKSTKKISKGAAQVAFKKAEALFLKDSFSNYWQAQNILIEALEGAPRAKPLRSLLCLTYRELWPFSYQDSKDLKVFERIAKKTSAMDPGGRHGAICDVALAIARGKYDQAGNLAKSALPNYQTEAVFFEVQALVFGNSEQRFAVAIDYLRTIENIRPKWVKPYIIRGNFEMQLGRAADALQSYRQALKINPEHPVAKIQIGILHQQSLRKFDKALTYISDGLNSGERISAIVLGPAYKSMAKIFIAKKKFGDACKYAKLSYSYMPTNHEIQRISKQAKCGEFDLVEKQGGADYADQLFEKGEYFLAQAEFKAIFKSDRKNARAAYMVARCMWKLHQSREAFEWLDRTIKVDPRFIDAYVKKAEYFTGRFDFRSAENTLKRARKLAPKSHLVFQGYARLYLKQQQYKYSIQFAERALRLYETDVESLSILVRANLGLGTANGYSRAYEKAIQLQALDQGNPEAQTIYIEALEKVQNLSTALAKTRELMELYPYTVEYRLLYGKLLLKDERFEDSAQYFLQVLQIDDKNKEALLEMGTVLQALGRYNEAREKLLAASSLDPSDVESIYRLGLLYLRANQPLSAIKQFERVLANNPLYPQAHYNAGKAAMAAGNLRRALAEAEEEAKINPGRPEPQLLLAEIYYLQRNYSKCISAYRKAIKYGVRKDSTTYVRQARCMRLAGEPSTARQLLQQALLIESGNPEAWKELGATCEMMTDMNCAVEGYRQYFNLAPNAPDRRQIEQRILNLQGQ